MTIEVCGVGKAYPKFTGRLNALATWLGLVPRVQNWVVRDISFSVEQGESIGLIGVNGAGKSTLLKLITGTAIPTEGTISVQGKVSALLELGMGFHPEFTGRQNVILAARMQGLSHAQLAELMPAIQDFAEIGSYFDQPVRTYSSGMFVRLAFSVATAVRPEVLIVDEALAVGDVYFQHKSFARIRSFRDQGTTLLFVSHDPGAIKSLCNRALLLGGGQLVLDGDPETVLDRYNALIARKEDAANLDVSAGREGRSGTGQAEILQVQAFSRGQAVSIVTVGEDIEFEVTLIAHEVLEDLCLGFMIKDRTGYEVFGSNSWLRGEWTRLGQYPGVPLKVRLRIPALNVGQGSYSLALALHAGMSHLQGNYDWWDKAIVFQVVNDRHREHFLGLCALEAEFIDLSPPAHDSPSTVR